MKINNGTSIYFTGVAPKYSYKGFEIRPINTDPKENFRQVTDAIQATQNSTQLGKGLNGATYPFQWEGRDLVVKKYFPHGKSCNPGAYEREFETLDTLYRKRVKSKGIQQGEFAFRTPEGDEYLVTSRVKGQKPDYIKNKFNRENLKDLLLLLAKLDMPRSNRRYEDDEYPYECLMHYDLASGNIVIDEDSAGIIDFEYLKPENLNRHYERGKEDFPDANCNFSDIACLPSNLRGFEYRTLVPYLMKLDKEEASKLFDDYLEAKKMYHEFYINYCPMESTEAEKEIFRRKLAHYSVLENPNDDVKKAEAIKMQIARFMYIQSPYKKHGKHKINVKEIHEYFDNALFFFMEKANDPQNNEYEQIYYEDGLELIKKWRSLHGWMEEQFQNPDIRNNFFISSLHGDKQKEISDIIYDSMEDWKQYTYKKDFAGVVYDDDKKQVTGYYRGGGAPLGEMKYDYLTTGILKNVWVDNIHRNFIRFDNMSEDKYQQRRDEYKLFQSKLTDEHVVTLDEYLGL